MRRTFRRRTRWVNPIGWDEGARRVHDLSHLPGGELLHHSTCWCRNPEILTPDTKAATTGPGHEDGDASETTVIPVGPGLEVVKRHEAMATTGTDRAHELG